MTPGHVSNKPFNHTRENCDTEQKSSKFMLELMTLVSSANKIGSDAEFILRRRKFICIINNRSKKISAMGIFKLA